MIAKEVIRKNCMENQIKLNNGIIIPRLGQGSWLLGEHLRVRERELEAIQAGIEYGMTLIDTAEMYGDGASEILVGEAIKNNNREELYLISKVYPYNAGEERIFMSCEESLRRLNTDYLDLYLLHWRGNIPLEETVDCMERLVKQGKIRGWGVSNFDTDDMEELLQVPNGKNCLINQVLYHLGSRGVEYSLLPFLKKHNIPMMAYSPLAQAGSLRRELIINEKVAEIADKYDVASIQILLAFVLQDEHVIAIPKAGRPEHVRMNAEATLITLDKEDLKILNGEFPAPKRKVHLDIC